MKLDLDGGCDVVPKEDRDGTLGGKLKLKLSFREREIVDQGVVWPPGNEHVGDVPICDGQL